MNKTTTKGGKVRSKNVQRTYRTVICLAPSALVVDRALLPNILVKPALFSTVSVPLQAIVAI